jgi:hypothetical protein
MIIAVVGPPCSGKTYFTNHYLHHIPSEKPSVVYEDMGTVQDWTDEIKKEIKQLSIMENPQHNVIIETQHYRNLYIPCDIFPHIDMMVFLCPKIATRYFERYGSSNQILAAKAFIPDQGHHIIYNTKTKVMDVYTKKHLNTYHSILI